MKKLLGIMVLGVPIVCQKKLLQLTKHREIRGGGIREKVLKFL
jgi:hypothetical protein